VSAFLRENLILDLQGGGAGALEEANGALHVERVAEARVDVDDERQRADVADPRGGLGDLGRSQQPDVRHAELRVRDPGSSEVHRLIAEILDDACNKRVGSARHQERPPFRDKLAQRGAAPWLCEWRQVGFAAGVLHNARSRGSQPPR
jgi:hypothetical protein